MNRAAALLLPNWLLLAPIAFVLLTQMASTGPAWSSPFGFLPLAAERIPRALSIHGDGGGRLGILFLAMCAALAALVAGTAGLGAAIMRWLGLRRPAGPAALLAPLAGIPALAIAVQGAGLLGLVGSLTARVALAALVLAGVRRLFRRTAAGLPVPSRGRLAAGLGVLLLLGLPAAAPERHVDALIYHLPVPAWWRETGRITARPDWAFAHLSQHQETLTYALGAAWSDERWGKAISLFAAAWIGRLVLAAAGPVAALVAVTAPMLADLAGTAKNDVLFSLLVLGALCAVERGTASPGRTARLALGGWLLGGAYAVKNFGVFAALGLGVALVVAPATRRRAGAWFALALPAALVALPQIVRNALALGSPLYPFALAVFPPVGWTAGRLAKMGDVFNARTFPVGSIAETVAAPVLALAHASPYLLALFPLALFDPDLRRSRRTLIAFMAASFAAWAVLPTGGMVRFLLPLVPPAAILAAGAAARPIAGRTRRVLVGINLGFAVAVHGAAHLAGSAFEAAPLGAWTGAESERAFRERTSPVGTGALDWLERGAVAGTETVLVVGQGTQWPRPRGVRLLAREIEQAPWPWTFAREARDADRLAVRLRQWRIGAVLYNLPSANFWADDAGRYPWRPRDVAVWRDAWLERARPVRWSAHADPMEGFLILYALDAPNSVGVRMSLFLPGTESVFTAPRHLHYEGRPYGESGALLEPFREAFHGVGSFGARDATLALGWERVDQAAASLRALSTGLAPAERDILSSFGVAECGTPGRFAAWLREHRPPAAIHRAGDAAYFLNLGLPLAILPAGR